MSNIFPDDEAQQQAGSGQKKSIDFK